jgi:predicted nucleotidyltransferase
MDKEEVLQKLRKSKSELQRKFPLKTLALFGSYSRGEETSQSDVDVMVEFSRPVGIEFVDLVIELESILKCPVDLVTKKSIKATLKPFIEKDLIYV